jgi:hypothetical protein
VSGELYRMASEKGEPGFRRPRRWLWLLAICWLAGVTTYWWHLVPAVPERVIPLEKGQLLAGHTAEGSLVLARGGGFDFVSDHFAMPADLTGPLEVIDPLTGKHRNAIGNETWTLSSDIDGVDHAVFQSEERCEVVDLRTGRTVLSRPATNHVCLSVDGRSLATASGMHVSVIDLETGAQTWSREFPSQEPISKKDESLPLEHSYAVPSRFGRLLRINFGIDGEVLLHPHDGREGFWLDGRTGRIESRFQDVDPLDLNESPDGHYVLLGDGDESRLVSLADNREVCRIPAGVLYCQFNRDSTQVRELSMTESGMRLSRWSIPDGSPIGTVATDPQREPLDGCVSDDGRFFVTVDSDWGFLGSGRLEETLSAIGVAHLVNSLFRMTESAVQQTAEGRSPRLLARTSSSIDDDAFPGLSVSTIGKADRFAVTLPGRVLIFRFNPPRNWRWLAGWGLGPVVVVGGALRWRRRVSGRATA